MNGRQVIRTPLSAALSQLYGYIYCMLISNIVVGMPLFGGALYLCGCACTVLVNVYSRRNRKYLPRYSRRWGIVLGAVLLVIAVLLMGLYPANFGSANVWSVFAMTLLCLCADGMAGRIRRLKETREAASGKAWAVTATLQLLMIGAAAWVLFANFSTGQATALMLGFAFLLLLRCHTAFYLYSRPGEAAPGPETETDEISKLRAYHTYETISLIIVAALEMIVSAIYALLATSTEQLLPALAIGVGCALLAGGAGILFLRRNRKPNRQDPTWLICIGLVLCLAAIIVCSRMLWAGIISLPWIYACLAACSVGSTLSLEGLLKMEDLIPGIAEFAGDSVSGAYRKRRELNWELAQLLGDVLSLIALSVFCFVNGNKLPKDMEQLAARFQPVMMVPLLLAVAAALLSALRLPLSARYIDKLKLFLKLKREGGENPPLEKRLQEVVGEGYRQPWLTRFLCFILRPFMRHKLVNADHIVTDPANPLLFLCNHGEFSGPVTTKLFMPVPVRYWMYHKMMFDQKKVTAYLYENTYSRQTWLPVFARKIAARVMGWLSVNVTSQLEGIPVYRDSPLKLRETIRLSIEAMEMGDNLMIFPENPDKKYQIGGIGELVPGFLMLAEAYWRKTGKKLRILPMYADWEGRSLKFGDILVYEPENGFHAEQDRIIRETRRQINEMAGYKEEGNESA